MKIAIIGAGAIGLLYGGYLGKFHEVTLIPRTVEQAVLLNEKGITVKRGDSNFTVKIKAGTDAPDLNRQDLIMATVKQYDLAAVLPRLKAINPCIPVLFLQNGMGHLALLNDLPQKNIITGTVEHGAVRLSPVMVSHNGMGRTNLAFFRGDWQNLEQFINSCGGDFLFRLCPDYKNMLLRKCFANALINPLTAILHAKNGALLTNPHYYLLFRKVFLELISLFPELGREEMWEEVTGICRNTKDNESSMLKDIKRGSRTEIDAILGYMVETAGKQAKPLPVASALYDMVKGLEQQM